MADIKTPEERSINMSHIRRADTHPEVVFRKWLFSEGFRYSLGNNKILGHPDIWMPKYKVVIFIHGCFWHRHSGCKYTYTPKSNVEYWTEKFKKNLGRDEKVKKELLDRGLRVLIIWECTIKNMEKNDYYRNDVLQNIKAFLVSDESCMEL